MKGFAMLRMEKLASLMQTGRINPSKLITHKFNGMSIWKKL